MLGCTDGYSPASAPILDSLGNLYGGTDSGSEQGIVYELSPTASGWEETVLYTFCSQPECRDGALPGMLLRDEDGNLYGPTDEGGSDFGYCPRGCGVIFTFTSQSGSGAGNEIVLHAFQGGTDGINPNAISFNAGNLFGTTAQGGGSQACTIGCGTVFELSRGRNGGLPKETILHRFSDFSGGQFPAGAPVFDKVGNMYGVASFGGAACGCGLVYELKKVAEGWHYEILHQFLGPDGIQPGTSLTIDREGDLYGTTLGGSTGGVVFEIIMPQASPH
jgi:hypothetical protein